MLARAEFLSENAGDRAAVDFVDSIIEACQRLSEFPMLGRSRADLDPLARWHPVGKHALIYRVHDGFVVVMRVLHQSQDSNPIFGIHEHER